MSAINTIAVDKLERLLGTPRCPALIDVRTTDDFATNPRLIPGSVHRPVADTRRMDEAPQVAGLLAASLFLSGMYAGDLAQLEAGLALYDAFYRWCRDAVDETHTAHSKRP